MSILSVAHLSKNYGRILALADVSFDVPQGTVFGILGPNGSGKTTFLGIVMGVLKPARGTYRWFDEEPTAAHRRRIGALLETPNFYHYMTAADNLRLAARIKGKGLDRVDEVLRKVRLYERRDSRFSTFSLGMKQRLAIASTLLGDPELLVLDEPTNGLDPAGIAEIRDLIRQLHKDGKTILMASHLLDEVEKVCTNVALLKKGQLLTSGPVGEILAQGDLVQAGASSPELLKALQGFPGAQRVLQVDGKVQLEFAMGTAKPEDINSFCFSKGIVLDHLSIKRKSLETRFLELTENT